MLFLALSLPWPLKPLLYTPCIRFFIYDISLYLSKKKNNILIREEPRDSKKYNRSIQEGII